MINMTGGGIGGGYKKYLLNMLPLLSKHPLVDAILCAAPASLLIESWFPSLPKVKFIKCSPFRFLRHTPNRSFGRALKAFGPDVIFMPLERHMSYDNVPSVIMIQNMEPLASPVKHTILREKARCWAQYMEAKFAVKRSSKIVAISSFVRDFLENNWGVPSDKIAQIPFGAANVLHSKAPEKPSIVPESIRERFIFTVGACELYRGHEDIIKAMKRYKDTNKNSLKLVIAGNVRYEMREHQNKLHKMAISYGLGEDIYWTGYLNDAEMAWSYKNCAVCVIPSRIESFSLTAVEAMAYGCICISANNACLQEIFGESALYYTPGDEEHLFDALCKVLAYDNGSRAELSCRAKERAQLFSWDETADKTVDVLRNVITRSRG